METDRTYHIKPKTRKGHSTNDDPTALLKRYGCFEPGFLPLGRASYPLTGNRSGPGITQAPPVAGGGAADDGNRAQAAATVYEQAAAGFLGRLLGCLRLDCLKEAAAKPASSSHGDGHGGADGDDGLNHSKAALLALQQWIVSREPAIGPFWSLTTFSNRISPPHHANNAKDIPVGTATAKTGMPRPGSVASQGEVAKVAKMIEGCALRSAEAQLRDAVHYSPKSLEEEDATIAWLAAASTGGDGPSSSSDGDERATSSKDAATSDESLRQAHAQSTWLLPLAAIEQAQLPLPALPWQAEGARTATPLNGSSSSWHRLSSTLEAQRWREWTLVSLRRWEQSAYRTAWQELQRLLLQEEEDEDDQNPDSVDFTLAL